MLGRTYLRVIGEHVPEGIWTEISAITDHATLSIDGATHREKDRELVIPISRVPFVRKQRLAGLVKWRSYDRSASVPSEIRIGHVVSLRIDNRYGSGESETELERGLTAKGHKLFVVSVAEDRRKPFFLLEVEVDLFDITISDKSATSSRAGA